MADYTSVKSIDNALATLSAERRKLELDNKPAAAKKLEVRIDTLLAQRLALTAKDSVPA